MPDDPMIVNGQRLADILNLTRGRITHLVNDGMPKHSRGQFNVRDCVRWYIEMKLKGTGRTGDLNEARKELCISQKVRTDLETNRIKRELVDAAEVQAALFELSSIFGSQMEAIGGRLASELAHITEPNLILERLTTETRAVREAVANHVQSYANTLDGSRDHPPAAEPQRLAVG